MSDVSIMVLHTVQPDNQNRAMPGPNRFLLEKRHLWRDLMIDPLQLIHPEMLTGTAPTPTAS